MSDHALACAVGHRRRTRALPGRIVPTGWPARLVLAISVVTPPMYLSDAWLRVGQYVMIGAVSAIGLTLLTGQAGQLSLATPFFSLVGGASYCVFGSPNRPDRWGVGLPSVIAAMVAVLIASALGLAFAPVAGRVRGVYLGVATLSLVYVGLYVGQKYDSISGGTAGGRSVPDLNLFGFSILRAGHRDVRVWFLFLVLTTLAYSLAQGAVRGRPGRAWRLVRDNEFAAAALGVPVPRVRAEAFGISSGYAGLAGVMTVLWYRLLKPDESEFVGTYSLQVAIAILAMVLIGGLGSVAGAIAGAALVNGLPGALNLWFGQAHLFGQGPTAVTPVIVTAFVYGTAIVLVVLFEPGGLAALGQRLHRRLGCHLLGP